MPNALAARYLFISEPSTTTLENLLADRFTNVAHLARQLCEKLLSIDPDAVKVTRLEENATTYGIGPKKNSEAYCYLTPLSSRVNLGFFHAGDLPDPEGRLEGTGRHMRHVKVTTLDDATVNSLRRLVSDAIEERKKALSGT